MNETRGKKTAIIFKSTECALDRIKLPNARKLTKELKLTKEQKKRGKRWNKKK